MTVSTVKIIFILQGEKLVHRLWNHVPRFGDEVMIATGEAGKRRFRVGLAVWGVEGPEEIAAGMQAVNLDVTPLP